ncbi:MAG: tRNA-guanine transglycosylase [Candidatus Terrybacteria bacterium]|nr:tRNA-guanine transglycosylase [Candidatus Terrybacteria bacterium]
MFKIQSQYKKARTGILRTPHGKIKTPNMAFVATHGNIRLLSAKEQRLAGPELIIANTFHLWVGNKVSEIKKDGGIHKWSKWKGPIMTDSGGFQVFSLGWGKKHGVSKIRSTKHEIRNNIKIQNQVKITNDGAIFNYDEKKYELTPEKSIQLQHDIDADIIFAFDECTSPLHNYAYNLESLKRTHKWAIESLNVKCKVQNAKQLLFGIVQGGVYEKLRRQSSKFIGSLPFDGFGIGGSFGEKQMSKVIEWALSGLLKEKPRHLLGIGKIKDIFLAVEKGIDLFDCAIPTREARHGMIYTKQGRINIKKSRFAKVFQKDKSKAVRLATIHNIKFYKELFYKIRKAINKGGGLNNLKKEYKIYLNDKS